MLIPDTKKTMPHVMAVPTVRSLLQQATKSKLAPLMEKYLNEFCTWPAATTHHHNFTHGLLLHTAEVWNCAQPILHGMLACKTPEYDRRRLAEEVSNPHCAFAFTEDELFVSVLLHDFAKIKQYEHTSNHSWKKIKMMCDQETWTLRELGTLGISLTDNELMGLLHAEGGYTRFEVEWRPMSVVVHAADLWSSQAIYTMWDPASEMQVMCQKCGAPMQPRTRKSDGNTFFGCTKYPACNGIKDASDAPAIDGLFLSFLKRNYPVDLSDQIEAGDLKPEDLPF